MPKLLALVKNGLNYQEKASFLLIFTKSVEPIFQSAGPISRHTALKGTLIVIKVMFLMHNAAEAAHVQELLSISNNM